MIYNYGSINIDNVYRVPHLVKPGETLASTEQQRVLGGKGSNQSLALARAGATVTHLGAINTADEWVKDYLESSGVNIAHLALLTDTPSGHTFIQVDDDAENAIVLFAGANHAIPQSPIEALISSASAEDWLLAQNECAALEDVIHLALKQHMQVALNPAPMDASIANLPLNDLKMLIVNQGEALQLLHAIGDKEISDLHSDDCSDDLLMDRLTSHFPSPEIVLTLGSTGVMYGHGDIRYRQGVFKVKAKDTTGAGDTFVGYFLAARAEHVEVPVALTLARAASALCVQQHGASTSIPKRNEVEHFLSSTKQDAI